MKLLEQTGSTTAKIKVNTPIQNLAIVVEGDDVDLSTVIMTSRLVDNSGNTERLATNFSLEDAARLSILGKGFNKDVLPADVSGGVTIDKSIRLVEIGVGGALKIMPDEDLIIELSGLTAADTIYVYGIENGVQTVNARYYKKIDVDSASDDRRYILADYDLLLVDGSKVTEMRVNLSNGKVNTVSKAELELMQDFLNELTLVTEHAENYANTNTANNKLVYPLHHSESITVESIDIDTSDTTDLVVSNVKPIKGYNDVVRISEVANSNL